MTTPTNVSPDPTSGPVPIAVPDDSASIRALATQLAAMATPANPPLNLSQAVVVDLNMDAAPPTASITISGSATQVDDVRFMSGYIPVVGDTVVVLIQNGSVLILGHTVDIGTATAATGGWTQPTLLSGFTHNGDSQGNLMYRMVTDNGVFKMQWKGAVAVTGAVTQVLSGLPSTFWPSSQVKKLAPRGMGNGAAILDVQVQFTTGGNVFITGNTYSWSLGAHTHAMGTSDYQLSGYLSQAGSDLIHAHGLGTSASASTSFALSTPDWVSFNGLEYFL